MAEPFTETRGLSFSAGLTIFRDVSDAKTGPGGKGIAVTSADFLRALEQALEIDAGKIAGNESLADTEWWDSMAALTFMALADQELHVTISGAQLQKCKTVPDLLGLLSGTLTA